MKQVFSCQVISLLTIFVLSLASPLSLQSQEGDYTIRIKQPLGDTLYTCPGSNLVFVAEGQNANGSAFDANQVIFTWDFGTNALSQTGNTVSFSYPEGGHYILSLSALSLNGNPAQNVPVLHVFVSMRPHFSGTRSDQSSFCSGDPLTLSGFVNPVRWDGDDFPFENSYSVNDYVWEGPSIFSDRHGIARTEPPLDEGHLDYVFRVKDNFGCFHDTTLTLYGVYAEYSMDPLMGEAPLEVLFKIDSSSNGGYESEIRYSWEFYERTRDTADRLRTETDVYVFEQPGEYVSSMTASYQRCVYRFDVEQYIVVDSSLLEIPNVFTPNEDGANDYFQVKAVSLQSFQGQIFNRWGKIVYEWDDWRTPEAGWDGKDMNTGRPVPSGTYFYVIRAVGWDFDYQLSEYKEYRDKIYTGSVSLFR